MNKIINTAYADFGGMGDQAGLIDHHFSMMGGLWLNGVVWFGFRLDFYAFGNSAFGAGSNRFG